MRKYLLPVLAILLLGGIAALSQVNTVPQTGVTRIYGVGTTNGMLVNSDGSINATLAASTAKQDVNIAQMNGVTTTMGNGVSGTGVQRVTVASDSTGTTALTAGNNQVNNIGGTAGGGTATKVISAASTNATSVKASAGQLYSIFALNTNAATAFIKFYNTVGAPTCASDTVLTTFGIIQNVPITFTTPVGIAFATGIGLCITGLVADNDNTNATTGITVAIAYK